MRLLSFLWAVVLLTAFGCGKGTETSKTVRVPPTLQEEIRIVGVDGLRQILQAHRGEVILLNFWATWCGPCLEEMPHLAKLVETYGSQGVRVLAVSVDELDTLESAVKPFVRKQNYPFTFLIKEETRGDAYENFVNAINPEWGGGVPATFLYDRNGEQRTAFYEAQTYEAFEAAVKPYL